MTEEETVEEIPDDLSHDELLEATESAFSKILKNDTLLKDLPGDITIEEIKSQTAVEYGQSITLFIYRQDKEPIKVIVPQNSSVKTLKKAIARNFELYQKRCGSNVKISWKYIWKTYFLTYESIKLDNDEANIHEYGVTNKVTLSFKKKRRHHVQKVLD